MRSLRLAVIFALVGIFALTAVVCAQLPTNSDWPKFQRDYHNSGLSPATAIAKPNPTWGTGNIPGFVSKASPSGLSLDSLGNIYFADQKSGMFKVNIDGTYAWGPKFPLNGSYWGGGTLWSNGQTTIGLVGPGWGDKKIRGFDIDTGAELWTVDLGMGADTVPTVAANGRVYMHCCDGDNGFIACLAPGADPRAAWTLKWKYGGAGTGNSLGQDIGAMATTVIAGQTYILCQGDQTWDPNGKRGDSNIVCVRDDDTVGVKTWGMRCGYSWGSCSISNDGKTVYKEDTDCWTHASGIMEQGTLWAIDILTGTLKWKLTDIGGFSIPPAIGADGTLYIGGSTASYNYHAAGRLMAITDNGTSATVKWTAYLPDNLYACTSNVVVLNTSPAIIYVASGYSFNSADQTVAAPYRKSRIYAFKDMGSSFQKLWTYGPSYAATQPVAFPSNAQGIGSLAVKNDGTLIATWGKQALTFPAGWTESGIQGIVRDAAGNPVKGAYVCANTRSNAIADNADDRMTQTDENGFYRINVIAGNYYVQAWAPGTLASDDIAVATTTDTEAKTVNLQLGNIGGNRALFRNATASVSGSSYPAFYAVDSDETTRWGSGNDNNATAPSEGTPITLQVDLGASYSINQAAITWYRGFATDYKVQYSDDGAAWNDAYTCIGGTGGLHEWRSYDNVIEFTVAYDVLKFASPISARYWRVYMTKPDADSAWKLVSIREFQLNDGSGTPPPPAITDPRSIGDAAVGTPASISNARITAVQGGAIPTDTFYVETADRRGAGECRLVNFAATAAGLGDIVKVQGLIAEDPTTHQKYLAVANMVRTTNSYPRPLDALFMNSRAAKDNAGSDLFVKVSGKVGERGSDYFVINDGGVDIKVKCSNAWSTYPAAGSNVKVRGILSKEGDTPVVIARYDIDIAGASDDQPLPLAGSRHYFRDYLIIGPFAESTTFNADNNTRYRNMLANDFLGGEANIMPAIEDTVTYTDLGTGAATTRTWQRYNGATDLVDFNKFFNAAANDWSVAYAVAYIWSPTFTSYVDLTVGSDDSIRAYKDGVSQWPLDIIGGRGVGYTQNWGSNNNAGIDLNPGLNVFVFKIANGTGGFGLSANLIYLGSNSNTAGWAVGLPVEGLGYYPNKPGAPAP